MRTPVIGPSEIPVLRRPEWIQVRAPDGATYKRGFGPVRSGRPSQRRTCRPHSAEAMTLHAEVLR